MRSYRARKAQEKRNCEAEMKLVGKQKKVDNRDHKADKYHKKGRSRSRDRSRDCSRSHDRHRVMVVSAVVAVVAVAVAQIVNDPVAKRCSMRKS